MARRSLFGDFELDASEHILRRAGTPIPLRPQAFRALTLLVERAGTLVTRDELRRHVWPDDNVVDFEHGLNTCIRQIRAALGDQAENARFIATVPRVGYRFVARVQVVEPPAAVALSPVRTGRHLWSTAARKRLIAGSLVLLVTVLLGATIARGSLPFRFVMSPGQPDTVTALDDEYVRARVLLEGWTPESTRTALSIFERISLQFPEFSPAFAGMAEAYLRIPAAVGGIEPALALQRGRSAVDRAVALDPGAASTQIALASLELRQREWDAATNRLRQLVASDRSDGYARAKLATILSLQGAFEGAVTEAQAAEALEPFSPARRYVLALVLRFARRYEDALAQARRTLELDPNFGPAHFEVGHSLLALGDASGAIAAFKQSNGPLGNLGHAYAQSGDVAAAREVLARLERRYREKKVGAAEIAQVQTALGEHEAAFNWLARAVEEGNGFTLKVARVWDPLRSDPRFDTLLRRAGLRREIQDRR